MQKRLDEGAHGMQAGRGFHTYRPGDAERWDAKLKEFAWEMRGLAEKYAPLRPPGREEDENRAPDRHPGPGASPA